jgi:hypothetical protein
MGYQPIPLPEKSGIFLDRPPRTEAEAIERLAWEERRPRDLAAWVSWLVFLPLAWMLPWRRRDRREQLRRIKSDRDRWLADLDSRMRLNPPRGGSGVPAVGCRAGCPLDEPAAPYFPG